MEDVKVNDNHTSEKKEERRPPARAIDKLAAAFAKFQGECPEVTLDAEVKVKGVTKSGKPYEYTFRYATLPNISRTVRPYLSKNGLSYTQLVGAKGVTTMLLHESGQYLKADTPFVGGADWGRAQDMGGVISYTKRYALSAMLGIATEDDDDANGVSRNDYQTNNGGRGRSSSNGSSKKSAQKASKASGGKKEKPVMDEGVFAKQTENIQKRLDQGMKMDDLIKNLKEHYTIPEKIEKVVRKMKANFNEVAYSTQYKKIKTVLATRTHDDVINALKNDYHVSKEWEEKLRKVGVDPTAGEEE